jgi:hypothetical protein
MTVLRNSKSSPDYAPVLGQRLLRSPAQNTTNIDVIASDRRRDLDRNIYISNT